MKTSALTLVLLTACYAVLGQAEIPNAPQWQVTLQVIDEDGAPVPGADVFANYLLPATPTASEPSSRKTGLTDINGFATLSAHSGPRIGCGASKAGYYPTSGLTVTFSGKLDGKWRPWNPTADLLLKKMGTPIAMYVERVDAEPPVNGRPVGFDLTAGDWVAPDGKGQNIDILFLREYNSRSQYDYDYKLTVSFPNHGDGIQEFDAPALVQEAKEGWSELKSPHEAPANGYQPQWMQTDKSGRPAETNRDPHHNYFFRVRTVLDERGNIKSALYGKIYGDFMQFTYYLNPTPNDRNIEFDPKRNLLSGQNVTAP